MPVGMVIFFARAAKITKGKIHLCQSGRLPTFIFPLFLSYVGWTPPTSEIHPRPVMLTHDQNQKLRR
jgi:hypothetical protein